MTTLSTYLHFSEDDTILYIEKHLYNGYKLSRTFTYEYYEDGVRYKYTSKLLDHHCVNNIPRIVFMCMYDRTGKLVSKKCSEDFLHLHLPNCIQKVATNSFALMDAPI